LKFDLVVIGGGPSGERAAILAARSGKSVALIEKQTEVGGTGVVWGAIPSKTLRESALFMNSLAVNKLHGFRYELADEVTVQDFMYRQKLVVQREIELINKALHRYAIQVFHGHARFADPNTVVVSGVNGQSRLRLTADVFVVAVGTSPHRPRDVPFDTELVFDSDSILKLPKMPRSMLVLGAGVIGVEYASIFAALGLQVTMVDTRAHLLPYLDREIADRLEREMRRLGMIIVHDDHYEEIERVGGDPPIVRCRTRKGNVLEADVMLYCVGRDGNTADLGLENTEIEPNARGLLSVDENFRTAHEHIYAVGDVIGYPALASTSMEQGRQAVRHAFGIPGPRCKTELLPFAIYAVPEVSYIGESEEQLEERGVDYVVGRGRYDLNPRGQIIGDTGGLLKLLFERESRELRGVHIVGTGASDLIHIGQAFLHANATALQIAQTLYNYPTLADLYRHAGLEAALSD
jgi:NAD(P) transhydrogenase